MITNFINRFPRIETSEESRESMVQIGLNNKGDSSVTENLTSNNFVTKASEPVEVSSTTILIALLIIIVLKVLELIIQAFNAYKRKMKKVIFEKVVGNQNQQQN